MIMAQFSGRFAGEEVTEEEAAGEAGVGLVTGSPLTAAAPAEGLLLVDHVDFPRRARRFALHFLHARVELGRRLPARLNFRRARHDLAAEPSTFTSISPISFSLSPFPGPLSVVAPRARAGRNWLYG